MGDDDNDNEQSEAIAVATDIIQDIFQERPPNPEDQCQCDSPQCKELLLSRELDTILSPKVIFRHAPQFDKIWPLLTNRQMSVDNYLKLLSEYRIDRHCGNVWPPHCVAYRCRTCSDSPTMALCTDCFRNGNHKNHNYNMFKSRSGGACDCGFSILKESGYCRYHGKNASAKRAKEPIPKKLICVPIRSMPRLVHRLAISLRQSFVELGGEVDLYLDYLIQLANSSNVMRGLMIDALTSEKHYLDQLELLSNHQDREVSRIVSEGLKKLKQEQKGLVPFKLPEEWNPLRIDINSFCDNRPSSCFIDELTFWLVVFEFPQKLICFLLSFLMDDKYKQTFAKAFVNQYPRIVMILAGARSESRRPQREFRDTYEQLFRRVLQISAQIYNDAKLTKTLCDEEYTLHTLLYCLRAAIEGVPSESLRGVLKFNPLCPFSNSTPKVICFDKNVIRDRHLGSFTEDLNAILCSEYASKRLTSDEDLLNTWLEMLSYFQTMSPYKRELTEHTPYETGNHISVFTIEADFCLSPLWSILRHLGDKQASPFTRSLLRTIHANLSIWFHKMGIGPNSLLDPYYMSFHIPLHRMFAATLRHIMFVQKQSNEDIYSFLCDNQTIFGEKYGYKSAFGTPTVITMEDFFKILLLHPLQALTLYHETRSSMWTRNGLMTVNQAINYVHCAYSYSTIDLDMFLLKYCASKLNPNYFLKVVMSRFHAWRWLSFKSHHYMNNALDYMRQIYHFKILPEQITQMVENSLLTLIQLITLNLHCSGERNQIRQEMITLIAVLDRSYSYLVDMLPDGSTYIIGPSVNDEMFTSSLDELTMFKPAQHTAGNLQQGCYTLKPEIWDDEFDPVSVQYRFYQKRDYQMSLERYFQHAKLTGKLEKRYHSSALWPPLRVPRNIGDFGQFDLSPLIGCPSLVGIVFSILYKNLYIVDVPDAIMAYAIHFLELSLRKCLERKIATQGKTADQKPRSIHPTFKGKFCHRELKSCPAYMDSKGEAYVKGNTIFSVPQTRQRGSTPVEQEETKLFPVVRHALDLAFDTTWFPFDSVLENCLVHIENVYSLPWKEFEIVLNCQLDNDEQCDEKKTQASDGLAGSSDAMMSWCDDNDEAEEDDFEEGDVEEEEEEDNDDEDDSDRAMQTATFGRNQSVSPETDSDGETIEFIRQRVVRNDDPADDEADEDSLRPPNELRRTQDRATNTQSPWTSADEYLQAVGINAPPSRRPNSTTSQNLTRTTNTNTTTQSSSGSQRLCSVFVRQPQTALQAAILRSGRWADEINLRRTSQEAAESQESQRALEHEAENQQRQEQQASLRVDLEDVEMITVSYEQITEQPVATSGAPSEPTSANNLTYQLDANGAPPASPIRMSPSSSSSQTNISQRGLALVTTGDHTYSANSADTSMEVESGDVGGLSLVPFNREVRLDNVEAREVATDQATSSSSSSSSTTTTMAAQMYPENLVTQRRAIEASDPRPMITGGSEPLALEGPTYPASQRFMDSNRFFRARRGGSNMATAATATTTTTTTTAAAAAAAGATEADEQSLSDLDIQTRFMGFFQSRDQNRPNSRGFRRQTARRGRGGFSGPVPPFAVHNPNSSQSASRQARPSGDLYGQRRPQTERPYANGGGCFYLNRNPLSRSQQSQRNKRLRKDRLHHGESLLTLLLRLHAKYAQRGNSFEYNEQRARSSRSRIGDGLHFVTIVLDLICSLDQRLRGKLEHLQQLIWADKEGKQAAAAAAAAAAAEATREASLGQTSMQAEREEEREKERGRGREREIEGLKCDDIASNTVRVATSAEPADLNQATLGGPKQEERNESDGQHPLDLLAALKKGDTSADSAVANASASGSKTTTTTSTATILSPAERRRRAKEFQSKLMAEFASKQRAFIENYECSSGLQQTAHSKPSAAAPVATRSDKVQLAEGPDEEPINLSSKLGQETKPQMSDYDKQTDQHRQQRQQQQQQQQQSSARLGGPSCSGIGSGIDKSLSSGTELMTAGGSGGAKLLSSETRRRREEEKEEEGQPAHQAAHYECCICGVDGPSDLANPLGQVVLLQSTSVYGHSHLRPQDERRLPCEESQYSCLKEETYAKYLERRIDLLCEHFSESSWLDSINIGAEGGVHVQSCGHYLHIECHQSYIKSLDQEDRLRSRNDSDEFLCPVCRQLANSVLPILRDMRRRRRPQQQQQRSDEPPSLALPESSSGSAGSAGSASSGNSASSSGSTAPASESAADSDDQIALIGNLLEQRLPPNQKELQSSAAFCSHLTKATGPQYRLVRSNASMHSLFLFLTSIARTNLECELIVRSTARTQQNAAKRSCFQLLFHVLALNAQTLINQQWFTCHQIWSHLTHREDEKNKLSVKPMNSEAPLLLRDPSAILLQFLFAITNSLCYQTNFTCLVQVLFNLCAFQSIALVLSYVEPAEQAVIMLDPSSSSAAAAATEPSDNSNNDNDNDNDNYSGNHYAQDQSDSDGFNRLAGSIGRNLSQLLAPTTEEPLMNATVRASHAWLNRATTNRLKLKQCRFSSEWLENLAKLACLPFLRVAALIQHHLYDQAYPTLVILDDLALSRPEAIEADFSALVTCLRLGTQQQQQRQLLQQQQLLQGAPKCSLVGSLLWPPTAGQDGQRLVASWSNELLRFGAEFSIAARSLLLSRSLAWYRPSLMKLPHAFDDIFMFYYRKKCSLCQKVPKDVAICLVCGAPICFRVSCCKDRTRSRQAHSQHCGANTAVFLAVHTSSIVVIRGSRACVWGSVYLDAHDEEDNGLQRGKPLYLVQARFDLLEEQWLSHSLDHTCGKRWIYLQENQ